MLLLLECIGVCLLFTALIIPAGMKNPLAQIKSYPKAIQERVKSLPE